MVRNLSSSFKTSSQVMQASWESRTISQINLSLNHITTSSVLTRSLGLDSAPTNKSFKIHSSNILLSKDKSNILNLQRVTQPLLTNTTPLHNMQSSCQVHYSLRVFESSKDNGNLSSQPRLKSRILNGVMQPLITLRNLVQSHASSCNLSSHYATST